MPDIDTQQLLTVIGFLAALIVVMILVRALRGTPALMTRGRQMTLVESLALGPRERLLLVEVRGEPYLLCLPRAGAPALLQMGGARPSPKPGGVAADAASAPGTAAAPLAASVAGDQS